MNKTFATFSVVSLLGFALPVAALSVGTVTNAAMDASVAASTSRAHVGVSGSASTSASTTNSGLGTQVRTAVHNVITGATSASSSKGVGTAVREATMPIVMTRADIASQGNAQASSSAASVGVVHSDADLSSFIAARMQKDEDLDEVQASSDTIAVKYKIPAKFFGLFPASIDSTTVVSTDGTVTVSYPWWSFLFSIDGSLKAAIQDRLDAIVNAAALSDTSTTGNAMQSANASATGTVSAQTNSKANANASAEAQLNAQERAALIAQIQSALQTAISASASANADVQ